MQRFTGHSIKRPPKKCNVCRKPISHVDARVSKELECQCERCLHKFLDRDRTPGLCDACKVEGWTFTLCKQYNPYPTTNACACEHPTRCTFDRTHPGPVFTITLQPNQKLPTIK